jgi:hypothetical protein
MSAPKASMCELAQNIKYLIPLHNLECVNLGETLFNTLPRQEAP